MATDTDARLGADESDPHYHTARIRGMLNDVIHHVRDDVKKVDDAKAEALFETTAEVLNGLVAAYEHFDRRSEEAWR